MEKQEKILKSCARGFAIWLLYSDEYDYYIRKTQIYFSKWQNIETSSKLEENWSKNLIQIKMYMLDFI